MSKPSTFPKLYDEALQINISKLKQWGYLSNKQIKTGVITWSRNGNIIGEVSVKSNTMESQPYIELRYNFNDEPRNYKIELVCVPSNLGKGYVYYFLCPQTKKRCRILYSVRGYFLHRKAFNGCMYEKQTLSKKNRKIEGVLKLYFGLDSLYDELNSKHFKRYYAGKPTKRYLRIMRELNEIKKISPQQIEKLLLM